MYTRNLSRLHYRLRNNKEHPYRRGQPPQALLQAHLEASKRDRTLVREAINDTIHSTLLSIYADPRGYAEDCRTLPTVDWSLDHEEQSFAVMTCVLAFVARMHVAEPVPWSNADYLGRVIGDLASELEHPTPGSDAGAVRAELGTRWTGLSRATARIRSDLDQNRWPDSLACAVVYDAFASVESDQVVRGYSRRVWQALAEGGAAGLFWTYMFAATRRACERAVPSGQGLTGAIDCVADDVAQPIAGMWGVQLPDRVARKHRTCLLDARRRVLLGPEWDWARLGFSWSRSERDALTEFGACVLQA